MYRFGQHVIKKSCVFWETPLSFAFINIKPVVPGHILISSKRYEPSFTNLSTEETADLFTGAKLIGTMLKLHHDTKSLTVVIQDGPDAGNFS